MNQQYEMQQDGAAHPQDRGDDSDVGSTSSSDESTTAMVLGLIGLIVPLAGFILCPIAWMLGQLTLDKVAVGILPTSSKGRARAGQVLGMVGTTLYAVAIITLAILINSIIDISDD